MKLSTVLISVATTLAVAMSGAQAAGDSAAYLLLNPNNGPAKLKALADNAATIPINKLFLSFVRPGMVYVPNSNTLQHVGLSYGTTGDFGFADLKAQIAKLRAGGVQVYISMGGWNYNCWPYTYAYYSVGGYGTSTPNYWKIIQEGGGSLAGCTEANQWCYVCEPKRENTVLDDFDIFPEPHNSTTFQQAKDYIVAKAGPEAPVFHPEIVPGSTWRDPANGKVVPVPGDGYYIKVNRDPYQDFVYLAKDLGLDGIDVDYEEMWHADTFKKGVSTGPWTSYQTVYKYAAIMQDVIINIKAIQPTLRLGTAASAAGGLSTNWWGGNLKGIWYNLNRFYPDIYNFMANGANAGGVNVMTYDLSNNQQYHECPDTGVCSLSQQVLYYMNSYAANNLNAIVGYEIGTPAYPDPIQDPTHQLPLTPSEMNLILAGQGSRGGFFWELYKPAAKPTNVDPTTLAQAVCKAALGANTPRCSGVIPPYDGQPVTSTISSTATRTSDPVTSVSPTTTMTPNCPYPTWQPATAYSTGAVVLFNGNKYTAKWWTQGDQPSNGGPWADNGPCTGGPTPTVTSGTGGGSCSGVGAWASTSTYTGGSKVTYQNFLWTAQWWTQGETPGTASVWAKGAQCSATLKRRLYNNY
ncbi:hypothetical protein DFQ26_003508 [Actinomortierella ambigua]|nr:hypothetical protein DFQ26_003508 [Actinomortierella ambigua]